MKVRYSITNLAFKYPFTISRGTKTHQPSFIVELEHMGIKGYGEAPSISYYNIPIEKMVDDLESKKQFVEKFAFTEPARYWHYLHHVFPQNNFLVCALDMAAWDLYGKMRGQPLYKIWNLNFEKGPICDYTIGIDTIEKMIGKMKAMPWPIYKVKLGTSEDIDIVRALREHTTSVIRVDANAAWSAEEALEKIPVLQQLDVELIEQPLAKDDWEGMKKLFTASSIPLIADESCVHEADVNKCKSHFHGINIKLTKCGGITPALRMIENARNSDMKVMVGSMNESTVGTAAIAHLLPLLDYVDMDGPLLLAEDIATGVSFHQGKITLSQHPGLGIDITAPIF